MENAVALRNEGVSVARAAEVFVAMQSSPATRKAYASDLRIWFTWNEATEVFPTIELVVKFKTWLESTYKSRTAQRVYTTIKGFYRFLGGFNPFETIKAPKTVKNRTPIVPEDQIVTRMLDLVDNLRDKLVLSLLLNGLRRAEVVNLRNGSIAWLPTKDRALLKVVGKGNKERLIPASKMTTQALLNYGWTQEKPIDEPLFPGMTDRTVEYLVYKWSELAGRRFSPHKMRHHYATRLVRAKVGLMSVRDLLGHESIASTQIYTHLDLDDLIEAASNDPMD